MIKTDVKISAISSIIKRIVATVGYVEECITGRKGKQGAQPRVESTGRVMFHRVLQVERGGLGIFRAAGGSMPLSLFIYGSAGTCPRKPINQEEACKDPRTPRSIINITELIIQRGGRRVAFQY